MKTAISGFLDSIPSSHDSHYRGWIELLSLAISESSEFPRQDTVEVLTGPDAYLRWKEFDRVFLHHGLYYYGEDYSLNLFGGMTEDKVGRFIDIFYEILDAGIEKFSSLEASWPKTMTASIRSRVASMSGISKGRLLELIQAFEDMPTPPEVDPWEFAAKNNWDLVMGDSHSGASSGYRSLIYRNDRETLHGAIKRGFKEKLRERFPEYRPRHGTFHYGNIDIRHHLCRQPDPIQAAKDLVARYAEEIKRLDLEWVEIVLPYPIENETRKMSKSVYYKDTPFFGSWQQRTDVRNAFYQQVDFQCAKNGWNAVHWYSGFYNAAGELKFEVMEKPKSIHLSPRFYRHPLFMEEKKNTEINDFFS